MIAITEYAWQRKRSLSYASYQECKSLTFELNLSYSSSSITKWIVGARHHPGKEQLPELQIWRSMDSMIYTKVGFNTFTPNKVNIVLNVHQYIPNPPLEFQGGVARIWLVVGSPMKKSDFHRSNRTPIQCMQAIDLYVKTTKRAMLTLSFLAEK